MVCIRHVQFLKSNFAVKVNQKPFGLSVSWHLLVFMLLLFMLVLVIACCYCWLQTVKDIENWKALENPKYIIPLQNFILPLKNNKLKLLLKPDKSCVILYRDINNTNKYQTLDSGRLVLVLRGFLLRVTPFGLLTFFGSCRLNPIRS